VTGCQVTTVGFLRKWGSARSGMICRVRFLAGDQHLKRGRLDLIEQIQFWSICWSRTCA